MAYLLIKKDGAWQLPSLELKFGLSIKEACRAIQQFNLSTNTELFIPHLPPVTFVKEDHETPITIRTTKDMRS